MLNYVHHKLHQNLSKHPVRFPVWDDVHVANPIPHLGRNAPGCLLSLASVLKQMFECTRPSVSFSM